jgi:hypothetical protein
MALRSWRMVLLLGICTAVCLPADHAFAGDADPALTLFQEGRALGARGDPNAACLKFAESLALERKLGTLLNLGDCSERLGRIAAAWAYFAEASSVAHQAGDTEREQYAGKRAEAVALRAFERVAREVSRLAETRVRSDATAASIQVGRRIVAAHKGPWTLAPRVVPALALAGSGVLALAVGTGFGLAARSKWASARTSHCPSFPACDAVGVREVADAKLAAVVSTIAFSTGFAALAATAALWWIVPRTDSSPIVPGGGVSPSLELHSVGLMAHGAF